MRGKGMRGIYLMPKTVIGKVAVGLTTIFALMIIINHFYGSTTDPIYIGILFTVVGVSSFVACMESVIRYKDKSVLVLICGIISLWAGIIGTIGYWFV